MKKILIIDDNEEIRGSIKIILESNNYNVITADNGKSALSLLNNNYPDLMLLDIIMPDMEGIEFLRILRSKKINIPVIIMSGNPIGQNFFKTAQLLGAKNSIEKPFSVKDLLKIISKEIV